MIKHSELYLTDKKKWDLIRMVIKYEERLLKAIALIDDKYFNGLSSKDLNKLMMILEGKNE